MLAEMKLFQIMKAASFCIQNNIKNKFKCYKNFIEFSLKNTAIIIFITAMKNFFHNLATG